MVCAALAALSRPARGVQLPSNVTRPTRRNAPCFWPCVCRLPLLCNCKRQALLQAPKVDDLEALPRLAVAPELALAALPWVRAWAWPQELAVGLAGLAFVWAHAWAQLASALGLAQHSQAAQQEPPSVATCPTTCSACSCGLGSCCPTIG